MGFFVSALNLHVILAAVFGYIAYHFSKELLSKLKKTNEGLPFYAYGIPLIYMLIHFIAYLTITHINSNQKITTKNVVVTSSSQAMEGIVNADMNDEFLKNMENYFLAQLQANISKRAAGVKNQNIPLSLTPSSKYISSTSGKVLITTVDTKLNGMYSQQVLATAVKNNKLIRVSCSTNYIMYKPVKDIALTNGPCGKELKKHFGEIHF